MTAGAGKQAGTSGSARAGKEAEDPFESVVRFERITGPVLGWRLAGRRQSDPTAPAQRSPSAGFLPTAEAEVWQERLRRELGSKRRRPLDIEKRYVCRNGHVLLWLVRSPWGVTPIAKTTTGFRSRGSSRDDGAPCRWRSGQRASTCPSPAALAIQRSR